MNAGIKGVQHHALLPAIMDSPSGIISPSKLFFCKLLLVELVSSGPMKYHLLKEVDDILNVTTHLGNDHVDKHIW